MVWERNRLNSLSILSQGIVVLALFCLCPRPAAAQEAMVDRTAAARALFDQGLELLNQERWREAADRFQRALVLRPSAQITYNLTTALMELGRLVRASELLRQITLDPTVEPEIRDAAGRRRSQILSRLPTLTITVSNEMENVDLYLNERLLENTLVGVPFPVDPGQHVVIARRDGAEVARRQVNFAEGEERTISLSWGENTTIEERGSSQGAQGDMANDNGDAEPPRRSVARQWWFWTIIGVAAVGLGFGLGFGLGWQERQGDPVGGLGGTLYFGEDP